MLLHRVEHLLRGGDVNRINAAGSAQCDRAGYQRHIRAHIACLLGDRIAHFSSGMIGEVAHGIKWLLCGAGGDEHMQSVQWQRFCGLVRTQQISYGSFDRSRLLHAPLANILAGKHTGSRLHNGPSEFTAGIEIALRHGILIHVHVHGRA